MITVFDDLQPKSFSFQEEKCIQSSKISSINIKFSSVAQSCPTLCDPMDGSMLGFPVHHQFLELAQTHAHWFVMPSKHLILVIPFSSCLQSFPASGAFPMSQLFTSGGQSTGASASASVLPMNIQGWFPKHYGNSYAIQLFLEAKLLSSPL